MYPCVSSGATGVAIAGNDTTQSGPKQVLRQKRKVRHHETVLTVGREQLAGGNAKFADRGRPGARAG